RAATVAAVRQHGHVTMPQRGPMTVSVPGFCAAIGEALEKFGTMPLARLLEPAIALAEEGVPLDAAAIGFFNGPVYRSLAGEFPALAAMFGPAGGRTLGERIRQPAAAATLRMIAAKGWRAFYTGALAQAWLAAARSAGTLLDQDDLSAHETAFVDA